MLGMTLIDGITRGVEPVEIVLHSKETFQQFLLQHGWNITLSDVDFQKIKQKLSSQNDFGNVYSNSNDEDEEDVGLEELAGLLKVLIGIISKVKIITQGTPDATLIPPLNQNELWQKLGRETIDRLTFEALQSDLPVLAGVLLAVGIAEINPIEQAGPGTVAYQQYKLNWEKLGDFFSDPLTMIKNHYGWDDSTNGLNTYRFYENLSHILSLCGFHPRSETPDHVLLDKFYSPSNSLRDGIRILKVPFHIEFSDDFSSYAEVGFQSMPIPEKSDPDGKPMGFILSPLFTGSFTASPAEDVSHGISLEVTAGLETDALFRLIILPSGIDFESDTGATNINAAIALKGKPETPYILIGSPGSSRLELEGFLVSIGFKGNLSDPEFIFKAGTGKGPAAPKLKFIFQASESDSFLKKILGDEPHSIDLSGIIIWSSKHGLGFEGTAGFNFLFTLHLALGPITIEALAVEASVGTNSNAKIGLGLTLSGQLGPLSFACEQLGVQLKLVPQKNVSGGILGNLDFVWAFQPPKGVGLSINAGAVTGGGYLFFDFDKEEYAGVLELSIANFISAKAIGLITTKMPDGSKGFSMLIIITVEFNPPYQLGYGFTLMGVGGLLGLHRTVLLDPLRDGVRSGAVNSIMFPQNVVANAPKIISDLKTIFPAYEGKFLIGPMGKLGYGTPSLISLSLGLIIEIPGNFAILGVLRIVAPDEKANIVKIQVAFVGTIDFDKKLFAFDASIFDSNILFMTLEGDICVRLKWGENPNFLMSVGGFHPSFAPPPLSLPTMRRLAINILNTDYARIRVECYQAITSNTFQFGVHADLYFGFSAISIEGYFGFDALFQFSPFYFIVELSASVSLKVFGTGIFSIRLKLSLEGTTPWRAKGSGTLTLLFFEVTADFDKTWGDEKNTTLPPIEILPKLIEELNKPASWRTEISSAKNLLVSLRRFEEKEGETLPLILHPSGELIVQQKIMPLTLLIDKVGAQKLSDVQKVFVSDATSNGITLSVGNVDEDFARAQYQNLSNAEKLSKPSFERMPGGVSLSMGGSKFKNGRMIRKAVEYEQTIIDKESKSPPKGKTVRIPAKLFKHFLQGNSISKSVLSQSYREKLQPFKELVNIQQEGYTVALQSNNKAMNGAATFASEMQAHSYMQEQIKTNPAMKKQIHVVPNFELQEA